jgi:hypothetical protein
MSLTHPDGATEDYRFFPFDKPAGSQVINMLSRYFGIEVEVKFLQALFLFKVSFVKKLSSVSGANWLNTAPEQCLVKARKMPR